MVHTSNHDIQEANERTAMRLRPIMPHRELQELGIYRKISLNQQIRTKCFRGSKWRVLLFLKDVFMGLSVLLPICMCTKCNPVLVEVREESEGLTISGTGGYTWVLEPNPDPWQEQCAYLLSHFSAAPEVL